MEIDPHFPPASEVPPLEDFRGGGWRSVASLGFLGAAFLLFVGFHVLPNSGETGGWRIWEVLWDLARGLRTLYPQGAVVIAAFLSFSLLILVAPFLGTVWRRSGWALWGALVFSGLSGAVFWLMVCINIADHHEAFVPEAGGLCLLGATLCNFVGLLLAGHRGSRSHGPDPVGPGSR